MEPTDEMRIDIEPIFLYELVEYDPPGGQSVETIVLVVLIPEFIRANHLSADSIVLILKVPLPEF